MCRSQESLWRAEDMKQAALMNARNLWARFVERQNDAVVRELLLGVCHESSD